MSLQHLNPQQLQAVRHTDGPLIVVAGAGSGKTRVITSRIVHLIREKQIAPEHILAITFTNKAAGEMLERVRNMLGHLPAAPWISTFHAFCLRILRRHIGELGYSNDFVIYDKKDQLALVKQCMKSLSLNTEAFAPKAILNQISTFKNDSILPQDIDRQSLSYGMKLKAAEVYGSYQNALRENRALDFDDLLILAVRLFREADSVARYYNEKFHYLLVDEFQDTNGVQYQLIRLLSRRHNNVCVVGDDDQSIYQWRGANLENILNFESDFPGATVIKLEENYRSTQNILQAAAAVVRENVRRKDKTLWTRNAKGAPVVYFRAEDAIDEAETVCDRVLGLSGKEGVSLDDIAVLYRLNAQSRALEDALSKKNIPHQVVGGLKFYERKEVKDIMAYMRVVLNPADSVALARIVNLPARGIGKTSLEKISAWCDQHRLPLLEGLRRAGEQRLVTPAAAGKIAAFVGLLDHLANIHRNRPAPEFLLEIYNRTGYLDMLRKTDSRENRERLANLEEFYAAVDQFVEQNADAPLKEFLDSKSLASDIDEYGKARGVLRLMTLHTCKGLEFRAVFIIGMENGLLPHISSMQNEEEYEEERRLCYVGFTRARQRLFISNARRRKIFGNTQSNFPSDFLQSIPDEVIERAESLGSRFVAAPAENFSGGEPSRWRPAETLPSPGAPAYSVGTKVIHPKFGTGVVIKREGGEDNLKVQVFFTKLKQRKTLAVNLANLIVV